MVNKCIFIGNCAADPEIKTAGVDTVANFRIGCSESWKDKNGEKQTHTEWISCVAWRKNAENIEKYVRKGQLLYIEGRMKTRAWEDKDGNKRYTTEILVDTFKMLGGKKDSDSSQPSHPDLTKGSQVGVHVAPDGQSYDNGDSSDLPF